MEGYRVQFCNYPELYPIEVLDVIKLRISGLITLSEFLRRMRKYGITYTWAMIYQGCVERNEYRVITPEEKEIEAEKLKDKVSVGVYRFTWHLKLKYTKRRYHEIHVDVTVEGYVEKHLAIPKPPESEIEDKIANELELAFEDYVREFWNFNLRKLLMDVDTDFESGIETFELDKVIFKEIGEELEGYVDYIQFLIKRYEDAEWIKRDDLARDFEPYVEEAIKEVVAWIMENEGKYLIKMAEEISERVKETLERIRKETTVAKIERMIRACKNITDLRAVKDMIESYIKDEKINEDEAFDLTWKLHEKAREVLTEQAKKWCKRLREAETLDELNKILKSIMKTVTWKSELFQPFKDYVLECARKRANELFKLLKLPTEVAQRRAYTYYLNQLEEIEDRPFTNMTLITDLQDLLRRIRRSKLKEKYKEELIKRIEQLIDEIYDLRCKYYKEAILKANKLGELRYYRQLIRRHKTEFAKCYDELIELATKRIEELRDKIYRKTEEKVFEKIEKVKDYERPLEIKRLADKILRLPSEKQYDILMKLIDEAKSYDELIEIEIIAGYSPIWTNVKFSTMKAKLIKRLKERKIELGGVG